MEKGLHYPHSGKGNTFDPAKFWPITLDSVPFAIFTSRVLDSMYEFLQANGFIEHRTQKGFLPKLSGTFKHTTQMIYVINQARITRRSLVVTLLDLKMHSVKFTITSFLKFLTIITYPVAYNYLSSVSTRILKLQL